MNRLIEQSIKLVKTELINEIKPILREAKKDMWNQLDTVNAKVCGLSSCLMSCDAMSRDVICCIPLCEVFNMNMDHVIPLYHIT